MNVTSNLGVDLRKFMIAVVAVGATVLAVPAAHAVPGCSAGYEEYNQTTQRGSGKSSCSEGIQRVVVSCYNAMVGGVYTVYGDWVGPDQRSWAACDTYGWAIGATWDR
jgi:hypothetical protein